MFQKWWVLLEKKLKMGSEIHSNTKYLFGWDAVAMV